MNLHLTGSVPPDLKKVLEDLISQINAIWNVEHDDDGHHSVPFQNTLKLASFITSTPLACHLIGASQSLNTGVGASKTWTKPNLSTGIIDAGYDTGNFLTTTGDTLIQFTEPGIYLVSCNISWIANAAGIRYAELTHTQATSVICRSGAEPGNGTSGPSHQLVSLLPVPYSNASPTVNLTVDLVQTSGGPLNAFGFFDAIKLS